MADPYAPNERFIAQARGRCRPGQFIISALLVFIGWSFLRDVLLLPLNRAEGIGLTRWSFVLELSAFALLVFILDRVLWRSYGRRWTSALGDPGRLLPDFARVLAGCLALYSFFLLLGFDGSGAMQRPLGAWLAFLPVALVGIALQTGAEEVFFRGFLHQYAATLFKSPILWMGGPALAFGLVHAANDPSSAAAIFSYVAWTTAFAVACIDLTARTGSIGAAWGLHLSVNLAALTVATSEGAPMSAAALFVYPAQPETMPAPDPSLLLYGLVFELAFLAVLWLMARNMIAR
ncbi:MAG: CPBP family intramembrane glutamic endopeptidase [Pseudomonadota bacterium]